MSRPIHNPLRRGSKREGIIEPDAPSIFHGRPRIEWQDEVEPRPEPAKEDDDDER